MGAKGRSYAGSVDHCHCLVDRVALVLAACGSGTSRRTSTVNAPSAGSGWHRAFRSRKRSAPASRRARSRSAWRSPTSSARAVYPETRVDEYKVYEAFIADLTRRAGLPAARSCPTTRRSARSCRSPRSSLCTSFTEDDHVFAVHRRLRGPHRPGATVPREAAQDDPDHDRPHKADHRFVAAGVMLTFDATQERRSGSSSTS